MYVLEITIFDKKYKGYSVIVTEIIEAIGFYDSREIAEQYKEECENAVMKSHRGITRFRIKEVPVNEEPEFLGHYKKLAEEMTDAVDDMRRDFVKKGLLEQFIDEEGKFKYEVTEKGREYLFGKYDRKFKKITDLGGSEGDKSV